MSRYPPWGMLGPAAIAWWARRTSLEALAVDGIDNVPRNGPVVLAARHVHHLLDAAILIGVIPRPLHVVVGLDWVADARQRRVMEWAARAAAYPIVLRPATLGQRDGYARHELLRYTRSAMQYATALLRASRVVLVFPEGYPLVDPVAPHRHDDGILPFARGYRRMIAAAERDGRTRVAIVPVGFHYERGTSWRVRVRFGAARTSDDVDAVEDDVRRLSETNGPAR